MNQGEIKQFILTACESYYDEYISVITENYKIPHGISRYEIFAFIAACKKAKTKAIIESGIRGGKSTHIINQCFNRHVKKYHIDIDREAVRNFPAINYNNCFLHNGNSLMLAPHLIDYLSLESIYPIGVIIDGPKDQLALNLAKKVWENETVHVMAVHDVHPIRNTKAWLMFQAWDVQKWFLADVDYMSKYGPIDGYNGIDEGHNASMVIMVK